MLSLNYNGAHDAADDDGINLKKIIRGATAPKSEEWLKQVLSYGSTGGFSLPKRYNVFHETYVMGVSL